MSIKDWLTDKLVPAEAIDKLVSERVRESLRVDDDPAQDAFWRPAIAQSPVTATWSEVRAALERAQRVCAGNPLAARIVRMTTDFVIGSGARLEGDGPALAFAQAFWNDPLNHMDGRIYRWCDELTRSGELFLVLSRNPVDGMSYVREVPALLIDRIRTDDNDLERELAYHQLTESPQGRWWKGATVLDEPTVPGKEPNAAQGASPSQLMLHLAINRSVGQVRGSSDLAQIAPWLDYYAMWLEDRVRINRFKGAYLWHVSVEGAQAHELEAKRARYSRVPRPGSIIVTDAAETWTAVQPRIGADDVQADGKAMRLMIAAGAGIPLHYLAEGESATRATAKEMNTATLRHYAHRQQVFCDMVGRVLTTAARWAGEGADAGEVRVVFEPVATTDKAP